MFPLVLPSEDPRLFAFEVSCLLTNPFVPGWVRPKAVSLMALAVSEYSLIESFSSLASSLQCYTTENVAQYCSPAHFC